MKKVKFVVDKPEQPKTDEQPTVEDIEMAKLTKQIAVDKLVTSSITAKTERLAAEAGYEKSGDLLAREAGIIEKETELEAAAMKLKAIGNKNAEILARIAEARTQVRTERQQLKADLKLMQDFELNFESSGSKWKKEQVEKELKWLFIKFAGQVYGYKRDDEAWQHVRRLEKLWLGLEKEVTNNGKQ